MTIRVGPLSTQLWTGVAADTKPTAGDARLRINDVFFETDTTKWYIWNGDVWTATASTSVVPPMA